jgi:hypothetical protein
VTPRSDDAAAAAASQLWATPLMLVGTKPHPGTLCASSRQSETELDAVLAAFDSMRRTLVQRLAARQAHFCDVTQLDQLVKLIGLNLSGEGDATIFAERITTWLRRSRQAATVG